MLQKSSAFAQKSHVMKGEDRQSMCNLDQEWNGESNDSPVICKHTDASKEDKVKFEETMSSILPPDDLCHTIEKQQNLKMIVRSQYWGRELKGRICRNVFTVMNVKAPLVITSQVVLYNTDGFWGCCPNAGKRVLELQEYHFSDASEGYDWDLYLVGTWVSPAQSIHDFFLLPQNQTSVDIERNECHNGWSFCGTCKAGQIRSGIDDMLRDLLVANDAYHHRYHHVHIDVMMNKVFDRETPRSRKVNNEKHRAERKKNVDSTPEICERQESSVTTEVTASTEHESPPHVASNTSGGANRTFATKVVGAAPPIPRLIPRDSMSYAVPMPHPMTNRVVDYQDTRWMGETSQWNHDQFSVPSRPVGIAGRSGQVASDIEGQGVYWHPAKRMPPPGGAPHQHPYWHQMPGAQFVAPQPYCHLPDMQMHQYYPHQPMAPLEIPYNHHYLATPPGLQQCHMMIPGNQHHLGVHAAPETRFCADPSAMRRDAAEHDNLEFFQNSFAGISMRDNPDLSPSPIEFVGPTSTDAMPPSTNPSAPISDASAGASPVAATETPAAAPDLGGSGTPFPPMTLTRMDPSAGGSPVAAASATAGEPLGVPCSGPQSLVTASGES